MDPVLPIGRYPYSHRVLGARPGGIESYRPLPQLGVLSCDRGRVGSAPWLLRFVTLTRANFTIPPIAHSPLCTFVGMSQMHADASRPDVG